MPIGGTDVVASSDRLVAQAMAFFQQQPFRRIELGPGRARRFERPMPRRAGHDERLQEQRHLAQARFEHRGSTSGPRRAGPEAGRRPTRPSDLRPARATNWDTAPAASAAPAGNNTDPAWQWPTAAACRRTARWTGAPRSRAPCLPPGPGASARSADGRPTSGSGAWSSARRSRCRAVTRACSPERKATAGRRGNARAALTKLPRSATATTYSMSRSERPERFMAYI